MINHVARQHGRSRSPRRVREEQRHKKPALWAAVEANDFNLVRDLLEEGHDVEEKHLGWTPLMKAAEDNHVEIMIELIWKGADIDETNPKGRTALSFAACPSRGAHQQRTP